MKKIILILSAVLALSGCSDKKADTKKLPEISEKAKDHEWYYFTSRGFEKTSLPQKSGLSSLKPWTETLRACDGNTDTNGNGWLIVNRLGAVLFKDGKDGVLLSDYSLFSSATASSLIFDGENPYITFSRSSFFNRDASLEENSNTDSNRPFLVRISPQMHSFYPAVTYGDLGLASGGEITGTRFDGKSFLCSVKKERREKTYFSYISFTSSENLESLAPYTVKGKVSVSETSEDEYRKAASPQKFKSAPLRLRKLLKSIPSSFDLAVYCKTTGGASDRLYTNSPEAEGISQAYAILADGWICAVFSDGTTYFNGALEGRNIVNSGRNTAFLLPKLPENYIYGPFCISGNKLAVAWEESDFYKTGRSGFLVVDLGRVLYGDL